MENLKNANAAIHFHPADYGFSKSSGITGRVSASRSFLDGLLAHARIDKGYCYAKSTKHYVHFQRHAQSVRGPQFETELITFRDTHNLARAGCIYRPGPSLSIPAWHRRLSAQELQYSLCGITHTTCTAAAMDAIADLLIAPVHPWDALICTSQAVHDTVRSMLASWQEYLADRLHAQPATTFLMPIIPLGINCDKICNPPTEMPNRLRKYLRESETVVVYVGRLDHTKKAHPLPMFRALQEAFRITQQEIHLLLVGWFKNTAQAKAFQSLGKEFAPDVRITAVDGNKPGIVAHAWQVADIFISLSDNIQETFGLTPIEAMAAGVPVVVSDWNGYKETVRHGVDGFRVPTFIPPGGTADWLAKQYGCNQISYEHYVGAVALTCVVDIGRCAQYLAKLIESPQLRREMGAAGKRRAYERYDWSIIIPQYQQLWAHLSERRKKANSDSVQLRRSQGHPLRQDPLRVFRSYASEVISDTMRIELRTANPRQELDRIRKHRINRPSANSLAPVDDVRALLKCLERGRVQLAEFLATKPTREHAIWFTTVAWLAKVGLIGFESPSGEG